MRIFVTSDTHFGHENIIKYCSRPFLSAAEMDAYMMKSWNGRVAEGDTVYFLGDLAMGRGVDLDFVRDIVSRLVGQKVFLLGNHDMPGKYFDGLETALRAMPGVTILTEPEHCVTIDGRSFVMSHYPPETVGRLIHLHGHTHTQYADPTAAAKRAFGIYDIGVDMYGGPVQITGDLKYLDSPKGWTL